MRRVSGFLIGVGHVGRAFMELLDQKGTLLRDRYGFDLALVGAVDRGGSALDPRGLSPSQLLSIKGARGTVAAHPQGRPGASGLEAMDQVAADLLLEASPTNLDDGQPGLSHIHAALERGWHVVSANKGPLVVAYSELAALARSRDLRLLHSGAVAGALPTVNIGQRDLAGCRIQRIEGLLNATTNYILTRMEQGISLEEALGEAQRIGIAEANPRLDLEGWDAANKLLLLSHSVLRHPVSLRDIQVRGILEIGADDLRQARARDETIKLLAVAEAHGDGYKLSVRPRRLPLDHPLARLGGQEMGILYETDSMGTLVATMRERGPMGTAAAMLRDVIAIFGG